MNWYAAKVKHQTERKVKRWLDERAIENYIPFHSLLIERSGRRFKSEKPIVPGLVFIRTEYHIAYDLLNEGRERMIFLRNLENHQLLVVPDKQMQDFMFLLDLSETTERIENESLKQGDRVRVIKGTFAGIEGELVRIGRHKKVVVRLEGLFSLAVPTYIPNAHLEKI